MGEQASSQTLSFSCLMSLFRMLFLLQEHTEAVSGCQKRLSNLLFQDASDIVESNMLTT